MFRWSKKPSADASLVLVPVISVADDTTENSNEPKTAENVNDQFSNANSSKKQPVFDNSKPLLTHNIVSGAGRFMDDGKMDFLLGL